MVQLLWQIIWQFFKHNVKSDAALPFLGVYPEELKAETWTDTCAPTFIAALFPVAKS